MSIETKREEAEACCKCYMDKYEAEKRKLRAYRKAVSDYFKDKWYEGKRMYNEINAEYRRILRGGK